MNQIVDRNEIVLRNAAYGEHTIVVAEPADIFNPERMEPYLREAEEVALKLYVWDDIVSIKARCLDIENNVITLLPRSLETLHICITTLSALFIPPECVRIFDIQIVQSNLHIMPDITHLAALRVCIIAWSNLEILPFTAEQWPTSIGHIDLGCNSFTSYNLDIARTLPQRCFINLAGNEMSHERMRTRFWAQQGYQINFGVAPAARTRNLLSAMQITYRFVPVTPGDIHYYNAQAHLGANHGRQKRDQEQQRRNAYGTQEQQRPNVYEPQGQRPKPAPVVFQPLSGTQTVHVSSICDSVTKSVRKIHELTDAKYSTAQQRVLIDEFIQAAYKTPSAPTPAPKSLYRRILAWLSLYVVHASSMINNTLVYNPMIENVNRFCAILDSHTPTRTTYGELLARIWLIVREHPQRADFIVNVKYEINESVGFCFTGRFNRLVNSLIGFVDGITVGISVKEQLQLEMGRLIASLGKGEITYDKCAADFGALFDDPHVVADDSITKAYKDSWLLALEDYRPEPEPEPEPMPVQSALIMAA